MIEVKTRVMASIAQAAVDALTTWLERVVRRAAMRFGRGSARRRVREAATARTEATPSFVDGRKAFSVALKGTYLTKYRATVSYTFFFGGFANTTSDRDFFSINFSLDF